MIKNERGFTIMELLVVIVIIGVLAAIGVPAYNNMTKKAKDTACQANMRNIQTAAGMYYAEENAAVTVEDTAVTPNDLEAYMSNITSIRCPYTPAKGYSVVVTDSGLVTVTCLGTHPGP